MADKLRVLFVCAKNDVRSVMAEALLRHTDSSHFEAYSEALRPVRSTHAHWSLLIT
jgi:protein-tyrosine-phosphatase